MHSFVALAHHAIKTYLESQYTISAPSPLPEIMAAQAAVFVTLHTADDKLRGCRGTLTPTKPNLAEAIIHTAIASATDDPRFPPMIFTELPGLQIKIDVLSRLEPVQHISDLNEKVYGVFIEAGKRRGVLLPAIASVDSVAHQLELVRLKAGITPDEAANLYRFTVIRYEANS